MKDEPTRDVEDRDHSLDRLQRWSKAPTTVSPERAARRVRARLPERGRWSRPLRWTAAAAIAALVVAVVLVSSWLLVPSSSSPGNPERTEAVASGRSNDATGADPGVEGSTAYHGALVVVPLRSGTVLYIAPAAPHPASRIKGEPHEAAAPRKAPATPPGHGSGPGRLHSRPRS